MENNNPEKHAPISPIKAIKNAVKKVLAAPQKIGALLVQSANSWVEAGKELPDPRFFFHKLIVEFELIFCYAASNAGKSIFCNQIAAEIAQTEYVLYIDCELSTKQYQRRSTNKATGSTHVFPEKLLRAEIDKTHLKAENLAEAIISSIEEAAKSGIKIVFVDNVTYICTNAEKGEVAVAFMHKLNALKEVYGLTIVVVAHSPKRDKSKPITEDDLYGSSRLMQLGDSAFAIGVSAQDPSLRYVKTTKYRADEYPYPANSVAVYRIEEKDSFMQFTYQGCADERDHLKAKSVASEMEDIQEYVDLDAQGFSLKQIAEKTGAAKSTIHRKLKKALDMGMVPTVPSAPAATTDPSRPTDEMGQMGQDEVPTRLPFKDEED